VNGETSVVAAQVSTRQSKWLRLIKKPRNRLSVTATGLARDAKISISNSEKPAISATWAMRHQPVCKTSIIMIKATKLQLNPSTHKRKSKLHRCQLMQCLSKCHLKCHSKCHRKCNSKCHNKCHSWTKWLKRRWSMCINISIHTRLQEWKLNHSHICKSNQLQSPTPWHNHRAKTTRWPFNPGHIRISGPQKLLQQHLHLNGSQQAAKNPKIISSNRFNRQRRRSRHEL